MPCVTGSPNCVTNTSGDQFGVLIQLQHRHRIRSRHRPRQRQRGKSGESVEYLRGAIQGQRILFFHAWPARHDHAWPAIPVAATVVPQSGHRNADRDDYADCKHRFEPEQSKRRTATAHAEQRLAARQYHDDVSSRRHWLHGHCTLFGRFHICAERFLALHCDRQSGIEQNASRHRYIQPFNRPETSTNATSFPFGSLYLLRATSRIPAGASARPTAIQHIRLPDGNRRLLRTLTTGSTSPLDDGTYALNGEGYTEDQPIFLLGGQHSIVASYSGDKSYNASSNSAAPDS